MRRCSSNVLGLKRFCSHQCRALTKKCLVPNAFAHTCATLSLRLLVFGLKRVRSQLTSRSHSTATSSLRLHVIHCHSFCDPLCLSLTWECRIDGSGDFSEVKQFPISNALCANFIAHGCSKMLHCCDKKDPLLWNWVETRW